MSNVIENCYGIKMRVNDLGLVRLEVGDVLVTGHIVDYVNESRARVVSMTPVKKQFTTVMEEKIEIEKTGVPFSIATNIFPDSVTERRGDKGLAEFLTSRKARRSQVGIEEPETVTEETEENNMPKETKEKKQARGGFAAEAREEANKDPRKIAKQAAEENHARGRLGQVMGFSTCSVLKRLGKEGVTTAHAVAIMAAIKSPAKKATISLNVGLGRRGCDGIAELTGAQVKELKTAAPEPVEVKAEPKAKTAKIAKVKIVKTKKGKGKVVGVSVNTSESVTVGEEQAAPIAAPVESEEVEDAVLTV